MAALVGVGGSWQLDDGMLIESGAVNGAPMGATTGFTMFGLSTATDGAGGGASVETGSLAACSL